MDDTELSVIRVRPPDCHCLPIQSKKHYVKSKSEHVLLTRTHLKALQTPKMCHCPPGYHAAVSPLTGDDAQSCRAAGGSQEALGYPQVGGRGCRLPPAPGGASEAEPGWELPAAHSAAQPGCSLSLAAPGSLTSWGALREEVPEKKQKPAAWPWLCCACSRSDCSHRAWTSWTEQARECICFSLKQLNAISIYIQMTAIQRERLFGWELGVPCITTLFRVSVYLCHTIPVKVPGEVNN